MPSSTQLTILSISARLEALALEGSLFRHEPTIPAIPEGKRVLWLTLEARDWCFPSGPHPDARVKEQSLQNAVQQMNAFVLGRYMDEADIWRLDPPENEAWEIKAAVQPQIRLFGWFANPKEFVMTHARLRKDLERKSGPKWNRAIAKIVSIRNLLLPNTTPYIGEELEDYIG